MGMIDHYNWSVNNSHNDWWVNLTNHIPHSKHPQKTIVLVGNLHIWHHLMEVFNIWAMRLLWVAIILIKPGVQNSHTNQWRGLFWMAEMKKKSAQNPLPVIPFHPGRCNQNRIPSSWMIIAGFWARVFFWTPFFSSTITVNDIPISPYFEWLKAHVLLTMDCDQPPRRVG